jgi:hypothetical protein
MPGAPILIQTDSYQGVTGEGMRSSPAAGTGASISWGFWIWLLVIGVLIPSLILGGLRAGGFQFVFKRR